MNESKSTDDSHLHESLAAARAGDEQAIRDLLDRYRALLHAHCYRMLGSLHDADDALQETLLRAWRGLAGFERRSSVRSWLYRIATNVCLTALERRQRRALPVDLGPATQPGGPIGEPLGESAWVQPYPDRVLGLAEGALEPAARLEQRESVELAFVTALQYLPGNQRAALILREVLGYSAAEVAELLETTPTAVNSALQHARSSLAKRIPERSQQATLRSLGDQRLRDLVTAYTMALEQGDIEAMVELLAEDVTWAMPPTPTWYQGHAAIRAFLAAGPFRTRWRHVPTQANGQPAVGCYAFDAKTGRHQARVLDVLTIRGERIAAVTAFIDADLFDRFDLPTSLPA